MLPVWPICKKWGVDWLDLYDGHTEDGRSYSKDILKTGTTTYFPGGSDCIHLNSAGYDAIYPYIAEWMGQIDPGDTQEFESYPYVVGDDLALSGSPGLPGGFGRKEPHGGWQPGYPGDSQNQCRCCAPADDGAG